MDRLGVSFQTPTARHFDCSIELAYHQYTQPCTQETAISMEYQLILADSSQAGIDIPVPRCTDWFL